VLAGCFFAVEIAMSPLMYRALDPFIQILKPISPPAPFIIQDSEASPPCCCRPKSRPA